MSPIHYIFAFFFLIAGFTESNHLKCPFQIMGTRKNCYREEKFKKILDEKPKYRNTRPNILINENTTILDMENVEKCCYERHCLYDCGFGSDYIEDSYFGRKMPNNLPVLIQKYYSFFKVFNKTEIDQLMDDSANDIVIEHWEIKLLELSDNRGKIERKQRLTEERKKRDENV